MIHAYASQANYWRHLGPIVDELRARGDHVETWSKRASQPWGGRVRFPPPTDIVMVASEVDARLFAPRPVVYVEHGAGQSYAGRVDLRGFPGGPGLGHVRLFIAPGDHVGDRWRERYPNAQVAVVGCPALDRHLTPGQKATAGQARNDSGNVHSARTRGMELRAAAEEQPEHDDDQNEDDHSAADEHAPIVAISSHWRCGLVPETMPATPLFESGIRDLVASGVRVLGHAHPRDGLVLRTMWDRLGVSFEVDPDVVLERASLLVCDSSSLMYEAAAVGVPVLALNSPRYRRDVSHGLRFWSHVPGLQCDSVEAFVPAVLEALEDPPEARRLRERAAAHVYAACRGDSAALAADAIERCYPEA